MSTEYLKRMGVLSAAIIMAVPAMAQGRMPDATQGGKTAAAQGGMPQQRGDKSTKTYQTIIYTSDHLGRMIQKQSESTPLAATRGAVPDDIFSRTTDAFKGIFVGYTTSWITAGVNAIGALATHNRIIHERWRQIVAKEDSFTVDLSTAEKVNDFYKTTSFNGAMDPANMKFDGIGCLRKEGNDTVFYISCHVDTTKLFRLYNHSKFQLSLDTLIINPKYCDLPNRIPGGEFSFDERSGLTYVLDINITSSWITAITQIQRDCKLGEFKIQVPVTNMGVLKYIRKGGEQSPYMVTGESFIVPRSYMGYNDGKSYHDIWGTGEYKISVMLSERCGTTAEFEKNWKADWKSRKQHQQDESMLAQGWKMLKSQKWDEVSKQWIVTTLTGTATAVDNSFTEMINYQNLGSAQSARGGQSAGRASGGAAPAQSGGGASPKGDSQSGGGNQPSGGGNPPSGGSSSQGGNQAAGGTPPSGTHPM